MKDIKLTIKQLRLLAGLKQQDVANEIGTTVQTVCAWENGKFRPKDDKIAKLAEIYNVTIEEVIEGLPQTDREEHDLCIQLENKLKTSKEAGDIVDSLLKKQIKDFFKKRL